MQSHHSDRDADELFPEIEDDDLSLQGHLLRGLRHGNRQRRHREIARAGLRRDRDRDDHARDRTRH